MLTGGVLVSAASNETNSAAPNCARITSVKAAGSEFVILESIIVCKSFIET